MNRIKNFKQFGLTEAFDPTMVALLAKAAQLDASKNEYRGNDGEGATGATGTSDTAGVGKTDKQIQDELDAKFGNGPSASAKAFAGGESGDFVLYLQHQQGVAGANGLIEASLGNGNECSDGCKDDGLHADHRTPAIIRGET